MATLLGIVDNAWGSSLVAVGHAVGEQQHLWFSGDDHRRRHISTTSNPMSAKLCPRCFTLSTMPGKRFRHKLCFDTDFTKSAWLRPTWPPPKIRLRQILSNRHQTLATLFGMARIAGAVVSAQSEVVRICTPAGGS